MSLEIQDHQLQKAKQKFQMLPQDTPPPDVSEHLETNVPFDLIEVGLNAGSVGEATAKMKISGRPLYLGPAIDIINGWDLNLATHR